MHELILKELKRCKIANIPYVDEDTEIIKIYKTIPIDLDNINIGDKYIIEVMDYIVNPPDTFDLHANWNHNNVPKFSLMYCLVSKVMGKMIYIDAQKYNNETKEIEDEFWSGWIPKKSIKTIRRI